MAWQRHVDPPVVERIVHPLPRDHTHGGQLVVSTPSGRRWHIASVLGPWDQGTFTAGAARQRRLYVSRGLGFAGVPYRAGCPSEITVHELRAA